MERRDRETPDVAVSSLSGRYPSGVDRTDITDRQLARERWNGTMEIEQNPHGTLLPSVGVVGPGRLGGAIARALRQAGAEVHGPAGRGEPLPRCDALVLCVPDGDIASAAAERAGTAAFTGHTSGAAPLSELDGGGGRTFALHPLQTFAGGEGAERFAGAGCAVAGTDREALGLARRLAGALGMRPFAIADAERPAYHAAASLASNFLVTLEAAAERVAGGAGLEPQEARELLAPLVRATVENWARLGPERALTGPIARGDEATVARQRAAVETAAPELVALFDTFAERTRALAAAGVPA